MKKILYTAAILMCFTSKCIQQNNIKTTYKNNFQILLEKNIAQIRNKNPNIQIGTLWKEQATIDMLCGLYYKGQHNVYLKYTMDNIPLCMLFRDIDVILFDQYIRNGDLKNAMEIANDRFLCKKDIINIENYNLIYNNIPNIHLLPNNQQITIGNRIGENNTEVMKILTYNEKLKEKMGENFDPLIESRKLTREDELSTSAVLTELIYKLADNNEEHMSVIDELLKEYCNLENHYFYGYNPDYYCNSVNELSKKKQDALKACRISELENFFIGIKDIIEKDSKVGYILLKYIPASIANHYVIKATTCNKMHLANNFAKKITSSINCGLTDKQFFTLNLNEQRLTEFLNKSTAAIQFLDKGLYNDTSIYKKYIPIHMQIALSAIKYQNLALANTFLKSLSSIIDLNTEFTYENKPYTVASYYSSNIYNRTRYFIEYKPDTWKMLNTNANEELESLIGWQKPNNITDCKLQKGGTEIMDMLWSIKPQNFDILYSFVEELLQYKYFNFNAILEYNGKFYTLCSILIKRHMLEMYKCVDFNGISDFLNKNKSNNILAPNLEADTNFIQMIKENNYTTVKNVMKYCLNDLRNYQTRSKLRVNTGSKLCVDIIKKMVEIQSSCN